MVILARSPGSEGEGADQKHDQATAQAASDMDIAAQPVLRPGLPAERGFDL